MSAAVASFNVMRGGVRLRVRVLATVAEVHKAYGAGGARHRRAGRMVHAFFQASETKAKSIGTLVLPASGGDLADLVPHEVTHAVMCRLQRVTAEDDERLATLVGQLTRTIRARLAERGIES